MRVVECRGCGTWFLDPCPADHELAALYPPSYGPHHFDALAAPVRAARDLVQRTKVRAIARQAESGARILDVGCGGGALLRLLRSHGDPSWSLSGWDYPGAHVEALARDGFDVRAAPVDAHHAPDASSADLIVLSQVIEHFRRPDEIVELCARTLDADGALFIETPDVHGLDARLFGRRHWGGFHFPRHLVLFHAQSLCTLLDRHGFQVISVEHLASPAFWNQSLHHRLVESPLARLADFFSVSNPLTLALATSVDLLTKRVHPTSNVRVIARKRMDHA